MVRLITAYHQFFHAKKLQRSAQTIVDRWRVKFIKNGKTDNRLPSVLPCEKVTAEMGGGKKFDYYQADSIYDKVKPNPLLPGGAQTGNLCVILEDKTKADLAESDMEVTFADILGKE